MLSFGGPFVNPLVKYAESTSTPEDKAPVKFHIEGDTLHFKHQNGSSIPGAQLPSSVINQNEDMFVIDSQVLFYFLFDESSRFLCFAICVENKKRYLLSGLQ